MRTFIGQYLLMVLFRWHAYCANHAKNIVQSTINKNTLNGAYLLINIRQHILNVMLVK